MRPQKQQPHTKAAGLEVRRVKLADLKPHAKNPRKHPEPGSKEWEALKKSIDVDYFDPLVVNSGKTVKALRNVLASGHLRCKVMMAEGYTHADAVIKDYDEARHVQVMLRANNQTGEWDEKILADLLKDIDDGDLDLTGFDGAEIDRLLAGIGGGEDAPEPQIDRAEELRKKWGTKRGQLWEIGEHRLLCGDSTKSGDVVELCDRADLVITDPPYSVNYAAKNRALQTIGRSNRQTTDIKGDTHSTKQTAEMIWGPAFENAFNAARNGAVIYCFSPQGGDQMMMMMMMMRAKWNDRLHQLIWRKNSPTFSMGRLDYQYQHEPILYTWKGTNHGYYGEVGRSVIDFDRPSASDSHPTMKPVGLFGILIRNSSKVGEFVFDPFTGSGTTLVACEQLKRRGRGIELDPGYCAVTLQRLADMGLTPKLVKP